MRAENGPITPVFETLKREIELIEDALERVHLMKIEVNDREDPTAHSLEFSRERFALGEMQLCEVVYTPEIKALLIRYGFSPRLGKVQVLDDHDRLLLDRYHSFLYNDNTSYVICFTPGQLRCIRKIPSYKGEMLDQMEKETPEHTLRLSKEVVILHGTVDDLESILRYRYIPIWG